MSTYVFKKCLDIQSYSKSLFKNNKGSNTHKCLYNKKKLKNYLYNYIVNNKKEQQNI